MGEADDEAAAKGDGVPDEPPAPKKTATSVRVLTVLAYTLSVSLAAILLSLYYVFLWDPQLAGAARRVAEPPAAQTARAVSGELFHVTNHTDPEAYERQRVDNSTSSHY
ncbi:uncharacterized protein LOC134530197 [Bacillus rossius redtenbacheri]|uniref:uncharacterized protein LOC134530197 n=1 Tax=Bacillus rossius redtenbacheri TaxID=93214 RepID=UPI002FDD3113